MKIILALSDSSQTPYPIYRLEHELLILRKTKKGENLGQLDKEADIK